MTQAIQLNMQPRANTQTSKTKNDSDPGEFTEMLKEIRSQISGEQKSTGKSKSIKDLSESEAVTSGENCYEEIGDEQFSDVVQMFSINLSILQNANGQINAVNSLHSLNSLKTINDLSVTQTVGTLEIAANIAQQTEMADLEQTQLQTIDSGMQNISMDVISGSENGANFISEQTNFVQIGSFEADADNIAIDGQINKIQGNLLKSNDIKEMSAVQDETTGITAETKSLGSNAICGTAQECEAENGRIGSESAASQPQEDELTTEKSESENSVMFTQNTEVKSTQLSETDSVNNRNEQPILQQITSQVKTELKQGNTEFQMQLHPKDLGKIDVKMVAKDGILTVELTASDPKTQQILLSNADELRSLIQTKHDAPVQIEFSSNEAFDYTQEQQSDAQQQQEQQSAEENNEQSFETTEQFISFMNEFQTAAG